MKTTGVWMDGNDLVERRTFDAEPFIEEAKALHSCGLQGSSEWRHAGHFPPGFAEYYCQLKGITYHELMANPVHIKNMLNDPDLSGFRVWKGRV